ncbi:protein phosphatase 2C domain-containing protein [Amycolatopsis sp. NPDC026612]|uniref:protein phosphatase 2C domain-containing protein n=1 Tax=Amycolatopsis sp. NPDC026612 TaxID=3155466 RepID=UPI0033CA8F75
MSLSRGRHRADRAQLRTTTVPGRVSAPVADSGRTPPVPAMPEAAPVARPASEDTFEVEDAPFDAPTIGAVERRPHAGRLPSAIGWSSAGIALDAGRAGPYWVSAGSLVGRGHAWAGTTRQDSYALAFPEGEGSLVLAVADGLGSRSRSQLGARHLAAAVAREFVTAEQESAATDDETLLLEAIARAQSELAAVWAPAYGVTDTRALACTLAVVVLPADLGTRPVLAARVGDSTVFTATDAESEPFDEVFPLGDGPINMVSASLPAAGFRKDIEIRRLDPAGLSKLVLCTDGVADDVYESPGVRAWLARRWQRPCTERWMLESLSYARAGSQDDRTAVVVWLSPGTGPARPPAAGEGADGAD